MYKTKITQLCLSFTLSLLMVTACNAAPTPTAPTEQPSLPPTATATISPASTPTSTQALTPAPSQTASPIPCSPASRQNGSVGKGQLDKPMDYHILLPPCYTEQSATRYPVLYLLHGQNFTQDQWLRLGIAETAAELMQTGQITPFLIILPYDHSYKQPHEYNFEQVFIEQLIPEIEKTYRTLATPQSRAIGGLSRGGAWAIYIASRNPGLFGSVGAHSPAIFYASNSALPVRLSQIPAEQRPVFYVDAGNQDVDFREIQKFTTLLNDLSILHEWRYNVGFHDEKYWSSHLEEYLRWYGRQFNPAP